MFENMLMKTQVLILDEVFQEYVNIYYGNQLISATVLPKSKKLKKNTTRFKCMHFINKTPKQKFPEQKIKF